MNSLIPDDFPKHLSSEPLLLPDQFHDAYACLVTEGVNIFNRTKLKLIFYKF